MMLCNLSHPTFHVPFSCQPLLSISACSFGCARRLAVLVAEVYLAHYFCACKLRCSSWSCERASQATFARKHLRLCRSGGCCGNALRVQLWPEPWERTSCATFELKSCDFAALHILLYLKLANFQPKRCGSALRVLLVAASGNAVHILPWCLKLAISQPELRECASRTA